MNSRDAWARCLKGRLERAGFKVRLSDPDLALARKMAGRGRDFRLVARGQAPPEEVQRRNSVFGGQGKRFRIVDYGRLNDAG
jgi:hypothetical protein